MKVKELWEEIKRNCIAMTNGYLILSQDYEMYEKKVENKKHLKG